MNFLSLRRAPSGNAMIIALVTVSVMTLAILGVSQLISTSEKSSHLAYESNAAGAASDALLEVAQYDASFHTPGHQVDAGEGNSIYSKLSFGAGKGQAEWTLDDRTIFLDSAATVEHDGYDGSEYGEYSGFMVEPRPTRGDDLKNPNWNELKPGVDATIPLFVDNTSCTQSGVSCN